MKAESLHFQQNVVKDWCKILEGEICFISFPALLVRIAVLILGFWCVFFFFNSFCCFSGFFYRLLLHSSPYERSRGAPA